MQVLIFNVLKFYIEEHKKQAFQDGNTCIRTQILTSSQKQVSTTVTRVPWHLHHHEKAIDDI